jgi:hypothetical protein
MKQVVTLVTLAATACSALSPALAQERPDLAYTAGPSAIAERGAAVMAAVRVPLGSSRVTPTADRKVRFDVVAGPSIRVFDGQQFHRAELINGDSVRFSFTPGHSTRLSLNGKSLVTHYADARIAAAEGDESDGGIGTLGWLGIAGGVILVGLGVTYLAYEDAVDCTEDGRSTCE